MKTLLKILGVILALIVILAVAGYFYINNKGIPTYPVEEIAFELRSDSSTIERGQKLALTLCAGCHMNSETGNLTGKHMADVPKEFGYVYSPNITQDDEHGIGSWSDADLVRLLRTGVKKDGGYAPPWMAKLPNMADEDLNAIISFLRSDHKAVQANSTPEKACEPSFLAKMLCNTVFKPFPMPAETIPMPNTENTVEWGQYLVNNLDCYTCHSADFKTVNYLDPPSSVGYLAGGNPTLDMEGNEVPSANITPDKETGIGDWSKEEFVKAVIYSSGRDGQPLRYPMIPYSYMSEEEIGAIYDYLQTVEPVHNPVK